MSKFADNETCDTCGSDEYHEVGACARDKRLRDEAYARGKADGMAEANIAQMLSDSFAHGKDAELAKVVAWLRDSKHAFPQSIDVCRCGNVNHEDLADALERGEHKK